MDKNSILAFNNKESVSDVLNELLAANPSNGLVKGLVCLRNRTQRR